MAESTIVILTDFGDKDYYVGILKGVIRSIAPETEILDLCHGIPQGDIRAAGFALQASYRYFPARTIFLCVVDPGVGGPRRPIIVNTEQHLFVGPDNGIFSGIYENEETYTVYEITADHYFRKPVSRTFHGRDIFAPVAAWLSKFIEIWKFGEAIQNPIRWEKLILRRTGEREFQGHVVYIDAFGNMISNFPASDVEKLATQRNLTLAFYLKGSEAIPFYLNYSLGPENKVFAVPGSSGFVEFARQNSSAAAATGIRCGEVVTLKLM